MSVGLLVLAVASFFQANCSGLFFYLLPKYSNVLIQIADEPHLTIAMVLGQLAIDVPTPIFWLIRVPYCMIILILQYSAMANTITCDILFSYSSVPLKALLD